MEGNGNNSQATPPTTIVLTITLDQVTGQVQANGPIGNPMLCFGMMEMAKHAIMKYAEEQAKGQRIVPAKALPFIQH
jgi:hypothetical protein